MRRNNMPRGGFNVGQQSGPLVTDHVELRDLDLELELLKRKREMIQQQQQLLVSERELNNRQRQYNYEYDQPRHMYQGQQQQYNSNQNYSHNFEPSPIQPFNNYGGGLLGKRPGGNDWRPNDIPKRSSGPQSGSKRKFGAGPTQRLQAYADRPMPAAKHQGSSNSSHYSQPKSQNRPQPWTQPPPLMGKSLPPTQRFNNSKSSAPSRFNDYKTPRPSRRDFKPTKVTKPKPPPPSASVGKLVSYPIPQRKGLVAATKLVEKVDDSNERSSFILRSDEVPSQQLVGRLELCLGIIIKDVKAQFGKDENNIPIFQSQVLLRLMKQAIRERIRTVMVGKYVGKVTSIVEEYRKVFPVETDLEILNVALQSKHAAINKPLAIRLEDAGDPEIYFKNNINRLLNTILEDMFDKVQQIYEKINVEEIKNTFSEIMEEDFTRDIQEAKATDKPMPEQNEITANDNVNDQVIENVKIEAAAVEGNTQEPVEESRNNGDGDDNAGKEVEENSEKQVNENPKKVDENDESEMNDKASESVGINDGKDKVDKNAAKDGSKTDKDTNASDEVKAKKTLDKEEETRHKFGRLQGMITTLMKRRLGLLLPKFKGNILKVLDVNEMYKTSREAITAKLEKKMYLQHREGRRVEEVKKGKKTSVNLGSSTPIVKAKTTSFLPYYVKIQGRPYLPKRKVMQNFLASFNPKSIKKHRNMHLLFVGFADKEDFDKMLAVKQTEIGNSTITIKVSERIISDSRPDNSLNSTAFEDDDVQMTSSETAANTSEVLNSDLDDQINDLLSSIRQEEESDTKTESKEVSIAGDAEATAETNEETNEDAAVEKDQLTEETPEEENVENGEAIGVETDIKVEENEGESNDNKMETDVSEKTVKEEANDKVVELKNEAKETERATLARMSTRNANVTPSTVRTRRASRLAQN